PAHRHRTLSGRGGLNSHRTLSTDSSAVSGQEGGSNNLQRGSAGQVPAQVPGVDLAAEARVVRRFAGEDARAAEAEKTLVSRAGIAAQERAQRFAETGIPREGGEHPAKMVAKD